MFLPIKGVSVVDVILHTNWNLEEYFFKIILIKLNLYQMIDSLQRIAHTLLYLKNKQKLNL